MSFLNELKRRNVLRVGAAYVVGSWLLIQVAETIFPLFGYGDTPARLVVIVLAIAFIPSLIFSWVFEITPEGLKRDADVDRKQSITHVTGKKLDRIILLVLALALAYFAFDKFVLSPARETEIATQAHQEGRSEALVESYGDKSIAVLPFVNMSPDPEQEFFSDGMTEELLNLLTKIPDLRVTARTSSFFFKDKNMPVSEIADALNVTHILEGSVRRDGNQVRITAQLIEAHSDTHLWSGTYDRTQESIFAIQDEVASAIAKALVSAFTGVQVKPLDRASNIAAYEAYRTGRLRWWRRSPQELHKAIELFTKAIEHDPEFAPAYAAIADSWLLLALYGDVTRIEADERAQPMIQRALEIDPESAEAFAALGLARWQIGQIDAGESALRQAIKLNEDYIPAYLWLGGMLGSLGRLPEQGQVLQQAMALDPLNELLAINFAGNLAKQGDSEAGSELLQNLISLRPDSVTLLRIISSHALNSGDLVAAWRYARQSYDLEPDSPMVIATLANAWQSLGANDKAERLLLDGLEASGNNFNLQTNYFFLLLKQGRLEKAERLLTEQFGDSIEGLPEQLQQYYFFQKGMIALVSGDKDSARNFFENAVDDDSDQTWDGEQVWYATFLSVLHRDAGNTEFAEQRLESAERSVRRARVNGVDDANIYYTESSIHAIRGESRAALDSLQMAYDRGFRAAWQLEIELRLESIHAEPQFITIKEQIDRDIEEARAKVESLALATP